MKSIKLGLFFCLFICFSACTTTFYIVRHAEKVDNSQQAVLSPAGLQRATVLRDSLLNKGVDSIFASTFLRTQQTATPLARALQKAVSIYDKQMSIQLVQKLNKIKNKNFLVVGHIDNVPVMVNALTGQTVTIVDTVFNKMFIVKTKRALSKKVTLVETTY